MPRNQATKSSLDFLRRMPRVLAGLWQAGLKPPTVPLVIRIGAAGHLKIDHEASLAFALDEIFQALTKYANEANATYHEALFGETMNLAPPQLRLVSQLAAGLDQLAATCALNSGLQLDVVLPSSRALFERDIRRNSEEHSDVSRLDSPGSPGDPVKAFRTLVKSARRVLELDGGEDNRGTSNLVTADYEQAASVILSNCDILLVAIHEDASNEPGGTRWIEEQAERLDIPVIRIPIDQPSQSTLLWTDKRRRGSAHVFGRDSAGISSSLFEPALSSTIIGTGVNSKHLDAGWFERGISNQLKPSLNEALWNERWATNARTSLADISLGVAKTHIDGDFRSFKIWADQQASAMAELTRGSFIFCIFLGILAFAGALIGLVAPSQAKAGKIVELSCLLLVVWFIYRSKRFEWRPRWLSLREMERCLEQAAWLSLLGRTRAYDSPAHLKHFNLDSAASWAASYLRAILRNASFPNTALDDDYIGVVQRLCLDNLISNQISYYDDESKFNRRADKMLESLSTGCVITAAGAVTLYLLIYVVVPERTLITLPTLAALGRYLTTPHFHHVASLLVGILGTLLPSLAAALSAMRHHGEYAQIAGRFQSTAAALTEVQEEFSLLLPDTKRSIRRMSSARLAGGIMHATDALLQEVQGWNAILRKKEIDIT